MKSERILPKLDWDFNKRIECMLVSMRESVYWTKSYIKGRGQEERSWKLGPDPEKIFLREVSKSLGRTKALLDIGCGIGRTLNLLLAPKVREAWGVDVSRRLIEVARRKASSNAHFRVADGRKLPFKNESFDVVISQRGPATQSEKFAKEMFRVLKNKGVFIAITIGERDKENIKRVFKRGQLYRTLVNKKTAAERHTVLLRKLGFTKVYVKEHNPIEYFASINDLIFRLERVPIFPHFHRIRDKRFLDVIEKRFFDERGVRTNSHRVIVKAIK